MLSYYSPNNNHLNNHSNKPLNLIRVNKTINIKHLQYITSTNMDNCIELMKLGMKVQRDRCTLSYLYKPHCMFF